MLLPKVKHQHDDRQRYCQPYDANRTLIAVVDDKPKERYVVKKQCAYTDDKKKKKKRNRA